MLCWCVKCAAFQSPQEGCAGVFDDGRCRALVELRESGDISAIGSGVNEWQVRERLPGLGDPDGFLLAGPYNSGILATGAMDGKRCSYAPAGEVIHERVPRIEAVCAANSTSLIAAVLQFVLGHPAVKTVIPGATNAAKVTASIALLETPIPDSLRSDLKSAGLIRPDAPVPQTMT